MLEPAAGKGALAYACKSAGAARVQCIEIDPRYVALLEVLGFEVIAGDFLATRLGERTMLADVVVMNSPYEKNADGRFLRRALLFAPRVVALVRVNALNGLGHYLSVWSHATIRRLVFLVRRPPFESVVSNGNPRSDFAVVEIVCGECVYAEGEALIEHWSDEWHS